MCMLLLLKSACCYCCRGQGASAASKSMLLLLQSACCYCYRLYAATAEHMIKTAAKCILQNYCYIYMLSTVSMMLYCFYDALYCFYDALYHFYDAFYCFYDALYCFCCLLLQMLWFCNLVPTTTNFNNLLTGCWKPVKIHHMLGFSYQAELFVKSVSLFVFPQLLLALFFQGNLTFISRSRSCFDCLRTCYF